MAIWAIRIAEQCAGRYGGRALTVISFEVLVPTKAKRRKIACKIRYRAFFGECPAGGEAMAAYLDARTAKTRGIAKWPCSATPSTKRSCGVSVNTTLFSAGNA